MPIEFAYAQARLQARIGQRPTSGVWQSLEVSQGLSHYLHSVRATSLRSSVQTLSEHADAHVIERSLRKDWQRQVEQMTTWLPTRWQQAVLWVRTAVDLPAVVHLMRGGSVFSWMREDPALQAIAAADADTRLRELSATEMAPLADQLADSKTAVAAWVAHWRSLWPPQPSQHAGLEKLSQHLRDHMGVMQSADVAVSEMTAQKERLERQLVRLIRTHQQRPVAMFSYLGLLALDLQRLRGGLVRRALFTTRRRE